MKSLYCNFCTGCGNRAKFARFYWSGLIYKLRIYHQTDTRVRAQAHLCSIGCSGPEICVKTTMSTESTMTTESTKSTEVIVSKMSIEPTDSSNSTDTTESTTTPDVAQGSFSWWILIILSLVPIFMVAVCIFFIYRSKSNKKDSGVPHYHPVHFRRANSVPSNFCSFHSENVISQVHFLDDEFFPVPLPSRSISVPYDFSPGPHLSRTNSLG